MSLRVPGGAALLLVAALGCQKPSPEPPAGTPIAPPAVPAPAAVTGLITGRTWTLVLLGERSNPRGAGDRAPTVSFTTVDARASGFAGCNRFSGTYTLAGDSLSFGPLMSTKMACPGSDQVEVGYLAALAATGHFTLADSVLTLRGTTGVLAEFRDRGAE